MSARGFEDVTVGETLPAMSVQLTRADLVRYAGAAGDFNPIHWSDTAAAAAGLPDVIAHGMLTMALAVRMVTKWCGDPGAVIDYGVTFTRPVVVAEDGTASVDVSGTVKETDRTARTALVAIVVAAEGRRVLVKSTALVRLP